MRFVTPEVVYPSLFSPLLPLAGSCAIAACGVFFLVGLQTTPGASHDYLMLALAGGPVLMLTCAAAITVVYGGSHIIRGLVSPRPLMKLDAGGVECALGRVWWRDVQRIDIRRYEHRDENGPNTGIWLSLTLRAAPDSSQTSGYFDGMDAKPRLDADSRLELPFTRDRQRIWDAVQAFYDGPVNDPVECSPSLLDGRPTASGRNSTG